jgi:radical SAM superfamily enzyme YgiQ (UPF0313 family)
VPDIVLTTLNAKYAHASFGLRYLMANLPAEVRHGGRAVMLEFDISMRSVDVLERILAQQPRIVGVGVYIWNAQESLALVAEMKRVRPDVIVVVGGPEVSYETDQQEICRLADYVVTGEADLAFGELCAKLLDGKRSLQKVIAAELPSFEQLALPYELYSDADLAHRVVYVEASRGCPFKCEFCLSSLDVPVRNVPTEPFLAEMQKLLDRGCRRFKFVDRTFNLNLHISRAILEFFLQRYEPGLFLHFEMIPDRLPDALRGIIERFPAGVLQFEVGVQTFDPDVSTRISRRQDTEKLADNVRFLRDRTGVHVHADLIVGLPGETIEQFGAGFDRLVALRPQEIQVGMLKRLRGTPIVRHDREFGMVYSPQPPYEVLQTGAIGFTDMQRMRRFARYWDLVANSGNFIETTPHIWHDDTPFGSFLRFSDWLFDRTGKTHAIALAHLAQLLFEFLTEAVGREPRDVAEVVWRDYQRGGRSDMPPFLRPYVQPADTRKGRPPASMLPRQARHLR